MTEFSNMLRFHFSQYKKKTYLIYLLLLTGLSFIAWRGTLDLSFIFFVTIVSISIIVGIEFGLPWRYRREFKKQKMLSCKREMIFSDDNFTLITEYFNTTTKYSSIEKIIYFESFILIYLSHNNFHFVPTRIFKSDYEKEKFLEILEKTGSEIVTKRER